jgi:CHAD domain-containing protein
MKIEAVPVDSFLANLKQAELRARRTVKQCGKNPTAEAIHEARRAIRKLRAAIALMPRRYRKDVKSKKTMRAIGRFYSAATKVRDLDIICQNISAHAASLDVHALLARARLERSASLNEGLALVEKIRDSRLPIPQKDSQGRLQRRLEKLVRRRADSLRTLYPKVAADEKNVKELHQLRKNCRELADVLDQAKRTAKIRAVVGALDEFRVLLGSIRDDDVVLDRLRLSDRSEAAAPLGKRFGEIRRQKYRDFLSRQVKGAKTILVMQIGADLRGADTIASQSYRGRRRERVAPRSRQDVP